MARRSFNRALGQTSLELKCLALFGACLLLVVSFSFFLYWQVTERIVNKQNTTTGRLLADQVMLLTHWQGLEKLSPEERTMGTDFGVMIRFFSEKLKEDDYNATFIGPDDELKDPFERDLLKRYLRARPEDPPEGEEEESPEGTEIEYDERVVSDNEYQYYQTIRAQRICLGVCHPRRSSGLPVFNPTGMGLGPGPFAEGDLMAVVKVSITNPPAQAAVSFYWSALLAVTIITAFLAMVAFYVTIRYVIVKPLRHLRDVSDAIRHGNTSMRAELHTGDEFEGLAVAFNRMLRHLVSIQDELRRANVKLDGKVDELAQVNMQLYEMNRVKSDFMATMSHELRTPLNSILGFSDVLASAESLDEKQTRYVGNIQKSGRLLLEMINNILDLAKIESGKMEVRLADFDVAQVIATQCDMARPLTERKNIDLETEIQPGLPPMHQDQGRVHQILNNLLSNAIKFTPEGGRVRVTAERNPQKQFVLKVTDTGVGIAEEDQQTIFEKFRQGSTAMPGGDAITREYSGTGLGLSIVKELCKLLGGEVSVESSLGTGSTFCVSLPWTLEQQPRLDSPLMVGLEEFVRPRLDSRRETLHEPVSAGTQQADSNEDP
ncbi:MAG TPA: HAMP domain-containing sensor histidine kinase [Thermoguttaceae bacterium]|nr:HAMP domain-containing sensor histidine kinase [Thermoguttaceae bacterium]